MTRLRSVACVSMLLAVAGCAEQESPEDAEDAPIVDDDAKADSVWFVEDNSWDSEAVLRLVNRADYDTLHDEVGLTSWPAHAIADARKPIATLSQLDALAWVGPLTFSKLRGHAIAHGYGPTLAEEYPPAGEAAAIDETMMAMSAIMLKRYLSGPMLRGQHAKAHGCVDATLTVDANLPAALRRGVFATPAQFRSIVRFSNGDSMVKADRDKDVRGMAIKLLGVPGPTLLDDTASAATQDFLLINHPTLMARNVLTYADLLKRANSGNQVSLLTFFLSLNLADWELRGLTTLFAMVSHTTANPLEVRYWSTTPYLLGEQAVKYSARPCHAPASQVIPSGAGDDYLREALTGSLRTGSACFELLVQVQTDPRAMPIEDPSVEWSETTAPFHKVATLEIPSQQVDAPGRAQACEKLSYTPWHALTAHRPLGGINRARKAVYKAIATMRHAD
jgi:hypothetical protein